MSSINYKLKTFNTVKLDQIVDKIIGKKNIFGAVFYVSSGDRNQSWCGASGNLSPESKYYVASINKLFIASIILKLIAEGKLSLDDKLSNYLPEKIMKGLHVINGKEYSNDITIQHMLSMTSGLPCYIADKDTKGRSVMKELESGIDQPWPTEKVIERVKTMKPHFPPGQGKKAKYIDTNHQILNLVIEKITGNSINIVLNNLFNELKMFDTYVAEDLSDTSYVFPYYKDKQINISQFITSTKNDIISTAKDQMIFIKAFFSGYFYPKDKLNELENWKSVFFPFQYGIGIQKFHIPKFLTLFRSYPEMLGHSGSTGTFTFYIPKLDVYITGCTNQQANPNVAFQTILKIIQTIK